jgi:hypothetical protein
VKAHVYTITCTLIKHPALFVIAKNWRQLICPSKEDWLNKPWSIHSWYTAYQWKGTKYWLIQQPGQISREL